MIRCIQTMKKTLLYGLCVGALCLTSLPISAVSIQSDCSGVKKAISKTRHADFDGAVDELTLGDWRSRDLAVQCFYRRVAKMKKVTAEDYWELGDAFLGAYREDADDPETALASTYLDAAEVAYRRAVLSGGKMAGSGLIEILVEQADRKDLPFLRREADLLLARFERGRVEAAEESPWRSRIVAWRDQGIAPQLEGLDILDLFKNQKVEKPVKLAAGPPTYPTRARMSRVEETIIMQAVIDAQGRIREAYVIKGGAMGLSEEAVRTIKTWRFKPAKLGGEPVPIFYNLTMNFKLQ